ncbi:HtrA protease/chaperone protein [Acidisarcina polymorpha]|uniref:HtrA protease/chaperone protein n=1 Tax=Acidisarcina polymorpha TaxID=2211140 RepID=A0A2Z5FWU9_9BACT|nr:PDZ domain-containing protein [Acidisarcina polymorpha]AXC11311.1 HtrA protease/chaperone protein [Acidisarcina polymorpha]
MIYFSRLGTLTVLVGGVVLLPMVHADGIEARFPALTQEMLFSHSSQGYLGVGLNDVDDDRASSLKLKDAHGAEIITVDQDAPAAKAGLKVHDVVIQMNGQRIEGVSQFSRMLHETPPGRRVMLVAMRDGQAVNITVQLADRATVAKDIIVGLDEDSSSAPQATSATAQAAPIPNSSGRARTGHANSFLGTFTRNRYYVGVELEQLTSGLSEYFGVHGGTGMLVGNVFPNTPAAAAGLKVADVIEKVNGKPIVSLSDWERAIRMNHGKQVQLTLIRDKKEQTLSMVVGEVKNSSDLRYHDFEAPAAATVAELQWN